MRQRSVVLASPLANFSARIEHVPKRTHIQAFIAELAVKAFHMTVLRGPSGFNMFQQCAALRTKPENEDWSVRVHYHNECILAIPVS